MDLFGALPSAKCCDCRENAVRIGCMASCVWTRQASEDRKHVTTSRSGVSQEHCLGVQDRMQLSGSICLALAHAKVELKQPVMGS